MQLNPLLRLQLLSKSLKYIPLSVANSLSSINSKTLMNSSSTSMGSSSLGSKLSTPVFPSPFNSISHPVLHHQPPPSPVALSLVTLIAWYPLLVRVNSSVGLL